MSTSLKPLQLVGSLESAPNPWKVALVLDALSLPWQFVDVPDFFTAVKHAPFINLNPNGRVPALVDPNENNLVVWESGAILEYVIDRYDTAHKLSAAPSDLVTHYLEKSLLHFQMSGQGPYFGQAIWFHYYHKGATGDEPPRSAVERYINEAERVTSVLDGMLAANGGRDFLTGEKLSYVDLAFVPWFFNFWTRYDTPRPGFADQMLAKYPAWAGWWGRLNALDAVRKVKGSAQRKEHGWMQTRVIADLAKDMGI